MSTHCSDGPVSSMPGSSHGFPEGSKCDQHPKHDAVARIQGETDSFGCEYILMCKECLAEYKQHLKDAAVGVCDWCKKESNDLSPTRDYDEGMSGRVYQVCESCRKEQHDEAVKYLEDNGWY